MFPPFQRTHLAFALGFDGLAVYCARIIAFSRHFGHVSPPLCPARLREYKRADI